MALHSPTYVKKGLIVFDSEMGFRLQSKRVGSPYIWRDGEGLPHGRLLLDCDEHKIIVVEMVTFSSGGSCVCDPTSAWGMRADEAVKEVCIVSASL